MPQDALRDELEQLLAEEVDSAKEREATTFDAQVAPFAGRYVLFGAGGLGKRTLASLRALGVEPLAFADSNSNLWGKVVEGLPVLAPDEVAARYGQDAAVIVTIWRAEGSDTMGERVQQMRALGCGTVLPFGYLYWQNPSDFLPYYALDLPHKVLEDAAAVREAFELLADLPSKREYLAQIRWRLQLDFDALPRPVAHPIYFPDDLLSLSDDEHFIDLGAFDGDSVEGFLCAAQGCFRRIDAFEPDEGSYAKLLKRVSSYPPDVREKIFTHPFAAGAREETVSFAAMGTSSSFIGEGNTQVRCVPLDSFLAGTEPTYFKLDIEGAELDALQGAEGIIRTFTPVVTASAYHRQDHLWRLPILLNRMSDTYRFFLRPHQLDTWDLVCYAIPKSRTRSQSKS